MLKKTLKRVFIPQNVCKCDKNVRPTLFLLAFDAGPID